MEEEVEEEEEEETQDGELTSFSFPSYPSINKESSSEDNFYAEARIPPEQQMQNDEEFEEERDFLNHLPATNGSEKPSASQSSSIPDIKETTTPAYRTYQQEDYVRNQKAEEPRKENAASANKESKSLLYDLFSPEEEAQQAKLKVYIVQGNETIDSLADRYQISAQHIARVNRIGEIDSLRAGQVVYIPVAASSNKPVE